MIVNKVSFAKLAGVGKASVTLSVQRGKLVDRPDASMDTDDPVNRAYLEKRNRVASHGLATAPSKPAKQAKQKREPSGNRRKHVAAAPLDGGDLEPADDLPVADSLDGVGGQSVDEMVDDLRNVTDAEKRASIRLKLSQARRHELKLEQDKGKLIRVDMVEKAAAKLNADIKARIQDLPRRIAPRILAMATAGVSEREVQEAMEREIDDALDAVRVSTEGLTIV